MNDLSTPVNAPPGRLSAWLERNQSRHGFLIALLAFTSFIYYGAGMTRFSFDDIPLILTNPYLRDWSQLGTVLAAGRAMRGFTFMLDYSLWGLDPMGYHATNALFHFTSALFLYLLLHQIFGRKLLAWLAAIIFIFHPIHTEAVIGIAHRKELLAMTFFCLAYFSYLRWGMRNWGLAVSLSAYALALLSKQVTIVLPAVLLAQELILPRRALSRSRRFLPILLFLALPAAAFIIRLQDFRLFGRFQPVDFAEERYSQILATSLQVFPTYLRLALFPTHLCLDYSVPPAGSLFQLGPLLGMLAIVGLILLTALLARRKPVLAFGIAWYLVNLAPVMNLIPANAFLAERYLYIPSAGICLILAGLLEELVDSPGPVLAGFQERAAKAVVLIIFLFGFFGFTPLLYLNMIAPVQGAEGILNPAWATIAAGLVSSALMTAALTGLELWRQRGGRLPGSSAFRFGLVPILFLVFLPFNICLIRFLARGEFSLAGIDINRAYAEWFSWLQKEARPGDRGSIFFFPTGSLFTELINLAVFWVGFFSLAVIGFQGMVRHGRRQTRNAGLASMLIMALLFLMLIQIDRREREWGQEVSLWKATVRENPSSVIGWNNLGRAYSIRKKLPLAEAALARAFALDPTRSDTALNLGILELQIGSLARAQWFFEKAIELSPLNLQARLNLGNCLSAQGNSTAAIEQYLEVLRLDPQSAHAHYNLAVNYQSLGQAAPALYHLRKALEIFPDYSKASLLLREIQAAAAKPHSSDQ